MDLKEFLGVLAAIVGFSTYIPYFVEIVRDSVKPHFFSWVIWGLLTTTGFLVSQASGGGWGAWIFGVEAVLSFVIAAYSLFRGEKQITRIDWICFISALLIFGFYILTHNAFWSAVFAAVIDTLGFIPTFRKSYSDPLGEPPLTYSLSGLGYLVSVFALSVLDSTTLIYPITLIITNWSFVVFLAWRRRSVDSSPDPVKLL